MLLEEDRAETTEQAMKKQVDKYVSFFNFLFSILEHNFYNMYVRSKSNASFS